MWVNRDWVGPYFPADTPRGAELVAYAKWCSAVEGNTSFYALPSPSSVERWADQAPADFRFAFKLPKTITHDRRLRDAERELTEFLERVGPLQEVLGPFSIQLPESFAPSDLDVLVQFVERLPQQFQWTVEVRHRGFDAGTEPERRLNDRLAAAGIDRVLFYTEPIFARAPASEEEREAHQRKPRVKLRPIALAGHPVVRLIAPDDGVESPTEVIRPWESWFPHVARWVRDGRAATVFVHTPDNRRSPEIARLVYGEIAAMVPGLGELPDPAEAPGQSALF
jgi:uncharacterized protein YecE (DUF72 family)